MVIVMYGISVMRCRSSSLSSSLFLFDFFLLTHFIKFSLLCSLYTSVLVFKRVFVDLLLRFSLTSTYEKVLYSFINLFATRKPNQRLWTDCMNGMHRVELFIRTTLCFNRLATVFGSWNSCYSMSLRQPSSRDNIRCV